MPDEDTDVSEMFAVHDVMRREYASLPLLVKSIAEADRERADVVFDHVSLLGRLMELHHGGEDTLLWPLVKERAPEQAAVAEMEAEHEDLNASLSGVADLALAWRQAPSTTNRAALHTVLIAFERLLLKHLGHEERDALPLLAQTVTVEEFATLHAHVQEGLSPAERSIILGMTLQDTGDARGEVLLDAMDPLEREAFERDGRARYLAYRTRLLGG